MAANSAMLLPERLLKITREFENATKIMACPLVAGSWEVGREWRVGGTVWQAQVRPS